MGHTATKQADKPITTIQVTHIIVPYWAMHHNRLCIKPVRFRLSHPLLVDKNNYLVRA